MGEEGATGMRAPVGAVLGTGAALGAAGALPALFAWGRPVALVAWLAIWAPALGALAPGALAPRTTAPGAWARALLVAGALWGAGLFLAQATARTPLPAAQWALACVLGLAFAGAALGALRVEAAWRSAGWLVVAGATLAALPSLLGLAQRPFAPPVAARLLDLSPVTLALECASVDWMRHPAVYEPVGTDSIGPELRAPWRGSLAGSTVLLVGCALAIAVGSATAARGSRPRPAQNPPPTPRP